MPKEAPSKSKKSNKAASGRPAASPSGDGGRAARGNGKQGSRAVRVPTAPSTKPLQRLPGESDEEREKRLAAREALTLKAFRIAYENHRRNSS